MGPQERKVGGQRSRGGEKTATKERGQIVNDEKRGEMKHGGREKLNRAMGGTVDKPCRINTGRTMRQILYRRGRLRFALGGETKLMDRW